MTVAALPRRAAPLALFSWGFRPFFLFAAAWGALGVPVWVVSYLVWGGRIAGQDGRLWHEHEMLFGYLGGVMAGFLLTAVPNWTGRMPVAGRGLMALVALWAAGRAASFFPGLWAAVVDSAFLIALTAVVWREVLAGRNLKNLPVCGLVSFFALANVGFHLSAIFPAVGAACERAALAAAAMMIALIGGRIVPSFTRNWMAARRKTPEPASFGLPDQAVLGLSGLALIAWLAFPEAMGIGALLLAAGLANGVRLLRWRGWRTGEEALVWILHVGYGAMALGLALLGASILAPAAIPASAAIHALTTGGVGVMTLAVMTRASLGHTGRERTAGPGTAAIYGLVLLAAAVRVAAAFLYGAMPMLLAIAAGLWCAALALFVAIYGPMLVTERRAPARS
jgi:uncharacterized protein involved in response to NO